MGDRLQVAEDVFNPHFDRFKLLGLLGGNRGLHLNILQQARPLLRSRSWTVARSERRLGCVEIDQIFGDETVLLRCHVTTGQTVSTMRFQWTHEDCFRRLRLIHAALENP